MSLLEYYCNDLGVKLEIDDSIIFRMVSESKKHYPKEFGGILLGRYTEDFNKAIITDIIIPTEFENSKTQFKRGNKGIEKRLRKEYNKKPSIIYLGEWHTHPESLPEPSNTDISTFTQLSEISSVLIRNPIMLIIGLSKDGHEHKFYVINNKSLYRYE
ncbi:Mov34/MPN/PAD-1 family protein [Marivirga salinae]|uniref:Mov34/MPN/PAD-1 family protein n=1 Tax=Marivirga salinarum TaxID=3059078 RepID=A0AA51N970_9BACT|nr:Mov34/MPN/PAD-1 family protein [Marivirga sp. BDSF4-3]WMN11029.1 Mov34/MPN/PAD-1 family protein [Marivirga sp. BDSF4-3]